jgi:hypothetical protein
VSLFTCDHSIFPRRLGGRATVRTARDVQNLPLIFGFVFRILQTGNFSNSLDKVSIDLYEKNDQAK